MTIYLYNKCIILYYNVQERLLLNSAQISQKLMRINSSYHDVLLVASLSRDKYVILILS